MTSYVNLVYGDNGHSFASKFLADKEMEQVLDALNDEMFGPKVGKDGSVKWNYETCKCRAYMDGPYMDSIHKAQKRAKSPIPECDLIKLMKPIPTMEEWCQMNSGEMRKDFILMLTTIIMVLTYAMHRGRCESASNF